MENGTIDDAPDDKTIAKLRKKHRSDILKPHKDWMQRLNSVNGPCSGMAPGVTKEQIYEERAKEKPKTRQVDLCGDATD